MGWTGDMEKCAGWVLEKLGMPAWRALRGCQEDSSPKEEWQVIGRGLQKKAGSHGGLRTNHLLQKPWKF